MNKNLSFIFLSVCIFLFSHTKIFANKKRLYIADMQVEAVNLSFKKQWENLLLVAVLREFKDYLVMSDDTVMSILKQGKLSQQISGKAEFLEYLANSLQFEDLIEAEIFTNQSNKFISLKWIQLKKESSQFFTVNQVQLYFDSTNSEFSISQAVKNLYSKTTSLEKWNSNLNWNLENLNWNWKIQDFSKLPLQKTEDIPINLLEGITTYLEEGDTAYKHKEFKKALETYLKLRESLSYLSESTTQKIQKLISQLETRIQETNLGYYQIQIEELDKKYKPNLNAKQDEWKNYKKIYLQEWKIYKQLPKYAQHYKIEKVLKNRVGLGFIEVWKFEEFQVMENYQSLNFTQAEAQIEQMYLESINEAKDFDLKDYSKRFLERKNLIQNAAISYVENAILVNLLLAESENSRAILERSMGKTSESNERKYNSIQIMEKIKEIYNKNQQYVRPEIKIQFNKVAELINKDSAENKIYEWRTFLNLPVYYIYNVVRGVSDIFVFKWGYGFGIGGEALLFGATPLLIGAPLGEVSTAYGFENYGTVSNFEKVGSPISNSSSQKLFEKKPTPKPYFLGVYGIGDINCAHFGIRICKDYKEAILPKKYSNINLTLGAIGLVQINIETHSILELPFVILGMNPDFFNLQEKRKRRKTLFSYGNISPID